MYPSSRVRCLNKVSTSSSATQVRLRRRADHGCTCWWDQGTRSRYPGNHSARGTRVGVKRSYCSGGSTAFSASCVLLVMLTDPSESLDASPKRTTFETRCFEGGADSLERGGDPDLGRRGVHWNRSRHRSSRRENIARRSTAPQQRARSRQGCRVSSSEDSNDSVSESGGTLAEGFWACLLLGWEADLCPPAVP